MGGGNQWQRKKSKSYAVKRFTNLVKSPKPCTFYSVVEQSGGGHRDSDYYKGAES